MKQSQGQGRRTSIPHLLFGMVIAGIMLSVLLEVTAQLVPPHYNPQIFGILHNPADTNHSMLRASTACHRQ
jgi:hypothetical protein